MSNDTRRYRVLQASQHLARALARGDYDHIGMSGGDRATVAFPDDRAADVILDALLSAVGQSIVAVAQPGGEFRFVRVDLGSSDAIGSDGTTSTSTYQLTPLPERVHRVAGRVSAPPGTTMGLLLCAARQLRRRLKDP